MDGTKTEVLAMQDEVSKTEEMGGLLEVVYKDGQLIKETSLEEIRSLLNAQVQAEKLLNLVNV